MVSENLESLEGICEDNRLVTHIRIIPSNQRSWQRCLGDVASFLNQIGAVKISHQRTMIHNFDTQSIPTEIVTDSFFTHQCGISVSYAHMYMDPRSRRMSYKYKPTVESVNLDFIYFDESNVVRYEEQLKSLLPYKVL